MSVVKPCIDDLLEKTDHNRFLLASLASKRACDISYDEARYEKALGHKVAEA